jgi:hypothetical protein
MPAFTEVPSHRQQDNPDALWIILTHRSNGSEVEIERRLAASSADAARIAVLMLSAHDRLEHGHILRVLQTRVPTAQQGS